MKIYPITRKLPAAVCLALAAVTTCSVETVPADQLSEAVLYAIMARPGQVHSGPRTIPPEPQPSVFWGSCRAPAHGLCYNYGSPEGWAHCSGFENATFHNSAPCPHGGEAQESGRCLLASIEREIIYNPRGFFGDLARARRHCDSLRDSVGEPIGAFSPYSSISVYPRNTRGRRVRPSRPADGQFEFSRACELQGRMAPAAGETFPVCAGFANITEQAVRIICGGRGVGPNARLSRAFTGGGRVFDFRAGPCTLPEIESAGRCWVATLAGDGGSRVVRFSYSRRVSSVHAARRHCRTVLKGAYLRPGR